MHRCFDMKGDHEGEDQARCRPPAEPAPIAAARSADEKLRACWTMKGSLPADRQERLLAKLSEVEKAVLSSQES
jgi:hypothetical protein